MGDTNTPSKRKAAFPWKRVVGVSVVMGAVVVAAWVAFFRWEFAQIEQAADDGLSEPAPPRP